MRLYIDTADLEAIRKWSDVMPLNGVTTNPTLLAAAGLKTLEAIEEIFALIGEDKYIHAQVVSQNYEDIVREANIIRSTHDNIFVKIPVTRDGFKAIKRLSRDGMQITATAVATPHQGLVAAMAGAAYIAPYINRIDNLSADGVAVAHDMVELFNYHGLKSKVIGASYKNIQQILDSLSAGIHCITLPPDMLAQIADHPLTETGAKAFYDDYVNAFGTTAL